MSFNILDIMHDTSSGERTHAVQRCTETGEGLTRHLLDAIVVNVRRAPYYARITKGKSLTLSTLLVSLELVSLLPGILLDLWAKLFNRRGIPVIAGDFISMSRTPEPNLPLRYYGIARKWQWRKIKSVLIDYRKVAVALTLQGNFNAVAARTEQTLSSIIALEHETKSLFSLNRHILESVGLAAMNSVRYRQMSGGRTDTLCKASLLFQLEVFYITAWYDKLPQECHARGAGIVENDVPPIPFEHKWNESVGST